MKHLYTALLLCVSSLSLAQVPSDYYDSAAGLTGFALKTELKNIVTNGHMFNAASYDNLFIGYASTDRDNYYENDNTLLDIYSENPTGSEISFNIPADECGGSIPNEGLCYNREHLFPQGFFNNSDDLPMVSDIHTVVPVDGFVNNGRSNYPFGVVSNTNTSYANGSKWGTGNNYGYTDRVFEPIDEFKGDIARAMLYFAVRYEDNWDDSGWDAPDASPYNPLNGTSDQFYETWFIDTMIDWHLADPVSQREIDRNNAAYDFQGNANPFVNHPEYVEAIWNATPDTTAPSAPTNLVASNPTENTMDLSWTASTDDVGVVEYNIYINGVLTGSNGSPTPSFTALSLLPDTIYCFRVTALDAAGNESGLSNEDCEVTAEGNNLICVGESFNNMPANSSAYSSFTWTGDNGFDFSATDARTDQTLDGRAITIRNGSLQYTDNFSDFIDEFTITTQRVFSGGSGTFDLVINGNVVGTIPYSDTPTTTTISNIDLGVEVFNTLSIENNSTGSNRVRFDNMSWTCGLLSTPEVDLNSIKIYPNPVNDILNIDLPNEVESTIEIYDILGKRVLKQIINSSSAINVQRLKAGIYILKITQGEANLSKRLIIN